MSYCKLPDLPENFNEEVERQKKENEQFNKFVEMRNNLQFTFNEMLQMQIALQYRMFGNELPSDSVEDFKYSILGLIGELGEALEADTRWKNCRQKGYKKEEKLDELVDCMAFLLNAILYSGFNTIEFVEAFKKKNHKNFQRINAEKEAENGSSI